MEKNYHSQWIYSLVFYKYILILISIFILSIPNADKLKMKRTNPSGDPVGQKSGNLASFLSYKISRVTLIYKAYTSL